MWDIYSEYDAMRGTVLLSSLLWIRQSDSPYSYWKTEFLIQPDLLIDFTNDVSDIGTTNENVIAELQEAAGRRTCMYYRLDTADYSPKHWECDFTIYVPWDAR